MFLSGAALFALGTYMLRPHRAVTEDLDVQIDYVERLAMVGQPWCIDELEALRASAFDPRVRDAAEAALLVILSR
jgi:hypothetical protein